MHRRTCVAWLAALLLGACTSAVDTTAPVTSADPGGAEFHTAMAVTLQASEPALILASLDGNDPQAGAPNTLAGPSPFTVTLPEGVSELRFYAVDDAGNRELFVRSESYLVDTTAPEVKLVGDPPLPLGVLATARIEWRSNEAGAYVVERGGDGTRGSGTLLEEGSTAADQTQAFEIPAAALPEDEPVSFWVYADDWTGRVGRLEVVLERAPPLRLTLAQAPGDVVVAPGGDRAYVARAFGREIDVVDVDPTSPGYLTIVGTIDVGIRPWRLALTPDATRLYVTNGLEPGAIAIVDTSTNAVLRTLDGVGIPGSLAFSPDGARGYFTDYAGHVRVIDTGVGSPTIDQIVDVFFIGDDVFSGAMAVTPDGTRALLNWSGPRLNGADIIDVDPASATYGQVVSSPVLPTSAFAGDVTLTGDGAFGYLSSSDPLCGVCRVDLAAGAVVASAPPATDSSVTVGGVPVTDFPWALALTADEGHLLAAGPNGDAVVVYGAEQIDEVARVTVGPGAVAVVLTPDGRWALVTRWGSVDEFVVVPIR